MNYIIIDNPYNFYKSLGEDFVNKLSLKMANNHLYEIDDTVQTFLNKKSLIYNRIMGSTAKYHSIVEDCEINVGDFIIPKTNVKKLEKIHADIGLVEVLQVWNISISILTFFNEKRHVIKINEFALSEPLVELFIQNEGISKEELYNNYYNKQEIPFLGKLISWSNIPKYK